MGTDRVGDINKEQERKNENNGSSKDENDTTRVQSGGTERCGIVVERERREREKERERPQEVERTNMEHIYRTRTCNGTHGRVIGGKS